MAKIILYYFFLSQRTFTRSSVSFIPIFTMTGKRTNGVFAKGFCMTLLCLGGTFIYVCKQAGKSNSVGTLLSVLSFFFFFTTYKLKTFEKSTYVSFNHKKKSRWRDYLLLRTIRMVSHTVHEFFLFNWEHQQRSKVTRLKMSTRGGSRLRFWDKLLFSNQVLGSQWQTLPSDRKRKEYNETGTNKNGFDSA